MVLAERIFLIIIAGLSVLLLWSGRELSMGSEFTIGPGFFPRYIAILLLLTVAISLAKTFCVKKEQNKTFFMHKNTALKVLYFCIALIVSISAIPFLGMILSIFLFMLYGFIHIENNSFVKSLAVAAVTSLIIFLIFKVWLGVPLPESSFLGI